jgi:hypothetical protein
MVVYHISCKNAMGFQNIFHRVSKKNTFFSVCRQMPSDPVGLLGKNGQFWSMTPVLIGNFW